MGKMSVEYKRNSNIVHVNFNAQELTVLKEIAIMRDVPITRLVKDAVLSDLYDKIEKIKKSDNILNELYKEINLKDEKLQEWYNGIDEQGISKKIFLNGGSSE